MTVLQPAKLGPLNLQNQIVRSATATSVCDVTFCEPDTGIPKQKMYDFYRSLALGHPGMIIFEHCFVEKRGYAGHPQVGIHCDAMIEHHAKMVKTIKEADPKAVVACQISHAGIGSRMNPDPLDVNTATSQQLLDVVTKFGEAAVRVAKAGYDAIELHAGHGYFLSQTISGAFNKREDEWNPEGIKLLSMVIEEAKKAGIPVGIKLQSEDYLENGMNAVKFCKVFAQIQVDFVEITGGTPKGAHSKIRKGNEEKFYYKNVVQELVHQGILDRKPVIVTGGFENLNDTVEAEKMGVQFFGFSRKFLRNDKFLIDGDQKKCIHCNNCFRAKEEDDVTLCGFANSELKPKK